MTYPGDPTGYSQPNQSGWQQPGNYPPQPQHQAAPDPYAAQPYSAQPYSAQPYSAQPYSAQPYSPPYAGEYGGQPPAYAPPGPGYGQPPGPGYGPTPGPGYGPPGAGYGPTPGPGYGPPGPGPGYGPPGQPGYGLPPARRSGGGSTGLIVGLLAGGLVLVLVCIGGVLLLTRSNDPSVAPTATVDSFLTALFSTKDVNAAMSKVCTERRSTVQVKFDSTNQPNVAGGGDIQVVVSWKDLRETVRGDNAVVTASAAIKVTGASGGYNPNLVAFWIFTLKADGDEWKVCGWS